MVQKKKKKKRLDNMTLLLIPLAVAINMVAYNVLYSTTMVILGDSIGTILVGAVCGPFPGAIVGILSNLVNVIKNPVMIVMMPLNALFGIILENSNLHTYFWIYWGMAEWKHHFSCNGRRFLGKPCQCCNWDSTFPRRSSKIFCDGSGTAFI